MVVASLGAGVLLGCWLLKEIWVDCAVGAGVGCEVGADLWEVVDVTEVKFAKGVDSGFCAGVAMGIE